VFNVVLVLRGRLLDLVARLVHFLYQPVHQLLFGLLRQRLKQFLNAVLRGRFRQHTLGVARNFGNYTVALRLFGVLACHVAGNFF